LLHFVAFFHVASLFSTGVDNEKVGVDNEKALELTNRTVFHRGRQWKSSRAGQQNNFFIFQSDFNIEISPKNATKHPVALWHDHAKHSGLNSIFCCLKMNQF
jgi:hypothetical protein